MMKSRIRARFNATTVIAAGLVPLFGAIGCSAAVDALGTDSTSRSSGQMELTIANMPIADQGAYFYALDNGVFDQHRLTVNQASTTGGSAAIAAMVAGDFDVVYSGADGVIKAAANGVPIRIVTGANVNQPAGSEDSTGLVVAPGVTEPSQLNGATIGTNALGNINQVFAQEYLAQHTVTDIEVVEMPFPEQVAALEAGTIQASLLPEPFASQAVAAGGRVIGYPYRIGENRTTSVGLYASTEQVLQEKQSAIDTFAAAMAEANAAANDPENREAVVAAILAHTKLDGAIAHDMTFVHWTSDVTPAQVQAIAELLSEYGSLKSQVDIPALFESLHTDTR